MTNSSIVTNQTEGEKGKSKPAIIWFTGLSASGKSSTANAVEAKLSELGYKVINLDGDQIRRGLSSDLGFSDQDRSENIRRIAEVAKIMLAAKHIVLVSAISPFQADRLRARNSVEEGQFVEVYMSAALQICEQRDPKKLYKNARLGLIKKFTGIESSYEAPEHPEVTIDSTEVSIFEACEKVLAKMIALNIISNHATTSA